MSSPVAPSSPDPAANVGFAYFGKLPGAGDFISRRMPYPLQQFWDRWCASGMEVLKERNPAPGWALWGNTPKWAFLLPVQSGVPIGQLGVLAPSCDRVGRNFPFLVTTAILDKNAMSLLPRAAPIALAWAHVVADAQSARMNIDAVDTALSSALVAELDKEPPAADGEVTLRPVEEVIELLNLQHYRDSLAVPFVPWQEDYGLIAVEAMQCAKPVVTFVDAGGPTELVHNGLSGYVVENTVDALAAQGGTIGYEVLTSLGTRYARSYADTRIERLSA